MDTNGHPPRLAYTVEEAAQLLGVSRAHLYTLIRDDKVRSFTLGSSRRIAATEIDRVMHEGVS